MSSPIRAKWNWLILNPEDAARKRLRAITDKGNDCLIAIPRTETLSDGAVLALGETAVVVRMSGRALADA